MGDIHLLGSNLHVVWLCLTYTVRFESIVLFIHILSTHNLLFLKKMLENRPEDALVLLVETVEIV